MSNLSSSFIFQIDMLKRLEDMFWTGSGHVLKTCPPAKMSCISRIQKLHVNHSDFWRAKRTWDLWSRKNDQPTRSRMGKRAQTKKNVGSAKKPEHLLEPLQIMGITPTKWSAESERLDLKNGKNWKRRAHSQTSQSWGMSCSLTISCTRWNIEVLLISRSAP